MSSQKIEANFFNALRENNRAHLFAEIVRSAEDAIISKTLKGIIISWNRAAVKIFGFTKKEAVGKHISIIIPRERWEEERLILEKIKKGELVEHFETVRLTKDGRRINVSATISPIKNKYGRKIGASKIARDITYRTEIEKQRLAYIQSLEELNNQKDELMAVATHEMKMPLTVISTTQQLLQLKLQADENIKFVNTTLNEVRKLTSLVNSVHEVSKLQNSHLELIVSAFDVNKLILETIDYLLQTTTNHKINFKSKVDTLIAEGDREKIGSVLVNILGNAIKYSPNGGEINVVTDVHQHKIIVNVSDNGLGIPEEDLSNIFTRFYRVGGLGSTLPGSGLGLFLASQIIKRHGEDIWATSVIGKGSNFYFTLPLADSNYLI